MSAIVQSFAESSVWDRHDHFRPVRQPVIFRIVSIGKIQGHRVDRSFVADFGVFYDPEDEFLLGHLNRELPHINWDGLIFWRRFEKGEIGILEPVDGEEIGQIMVRKRLGGDPSGETDWTNVVSLVKRGEEK